jgi:hypothetical protein
MMKFSFFVLILHGLALMKPPGRPQLTNGSTLRQSERLNVFACKSTFRDVSMEKKGMVSQTKIVSGQSNGKPDFKNLACIDDICRPS